MRIIVLLLIGIMSAGEGMAQEQLELEWFYFHPLKKSWNDLGKKGSVQEALIELGEMPDPFYGTNENKFGWFEEHVWEFKSLFFVSNEMLNKDYVELELPSVDTYAKFYLNDSLILETANAFIPHRVFIQDLVKEGLNEIHVFITPPVIYHEKTYEEMGYELPAPNDVHDNAVAPLTRKPQYQFGWDWSLRLNTIGFHKVASIYSYDINRVLNTSVTTKSLEEKVATLIWETQFAVKDNSSLMWESQSKKEESGEVTMVDGIVKKEVQIQNPELWWPKGHGEQVLYTDKWSFLSNDKIIQQEPISFGIRTSELVQEKDEWGTSYFFKINGRKLFCKGGDYIPQDIFPSKVSDEDVRAMVVQMADANFNMVRVWGGGYYPDDVFYETCDSLGLMVWQDLMFACAMYPGDDQFIDNVSQEFRSEVPRIAKHPSVVLFNGNNEVEVAWGNWGFQVKYGLYGKSAKDIEKAYDRLFKEVAPSIVKEFTNIPYIHTSPLSNWGKNELYNHGSQHYWGVWHGKDPIEDFGKKIGRFNAEYGFQSFPEYSTLRSFSDTSEWDLSSDVMKHHQKSYVGNDMILKHAKRLYGQPENFQQFVYFSQLTQSMAVSMAVAGHRLDFPRCGGTLYWQVNDCWPASSWSSIDYFGNWKALHYRMRDDFKSITVVEKYNGLDDIEYYLTSDIIDELEIDVKVRVLDLNGNLLLERVRKEKLKGQSSQKICIKELKEKYKSMNAHIEFSFDHPTSEEKFTRTFDYLPSSYEKATKEEVKLELLEIDGVSLLKITNEKFLRNAWVYADVAGISFNNNFQSLLPGIHTIVVKSDTTFNLEDFHMIWL